MPTYEKCDASVYDMAMDIMAQFDTHRPVVDAGVKIDFVFAMADRDGKSGEKIGYALKHQGVRALGLTRKISLKDRAQGRGDAEIALDKDWWDEVGPDRQAALLDHELHHIEAQLADGIAVTDDLGRPKLSMRKHDIVIGWFNIIAERHGRASMEREQARVLRDEFGQLYWPETDPVALDYVPKAVPETDAAPLGSDETVSNPPRNDADAELGVMEPA